MVGFRSSSSALVILSLAGSLFSTSNAAVVTLSPSKDNTLYEDAFGSLSDGQGSYLYAGMTNQNSTRRGLLAFDLSLIPAGSTVTAVRCTVHVSRTAAASEPMQLSRVLRDWGEGASNADGSQGGGTGVLAQNGDATWLNTFFQMAQAPQWTTPGGDFASTPSSTVNMVGVGFYTFTGDGLVQDVQDWLNAPSTNFGWGLLGDEAASGTAKRIDSRENVTKSFRPALEVTYTPAPAPGTVAFAVGASLGVVARRRR
jgi:hypothetical protein